MTELRDCVGRDRMSLMEPSLFFILGSNSKTSERTNTKSLVREEFPLLQSVMTYLHIRKMVGKQKDGEVGRRLVDVYRG